MLKIISIVGARPQFVKAAPIARALLNSSKIEHYILHTGQHYDDNMSAIFFQELSIPEPKFNLKINGSSHGAMTGAMLSAIETILIQEEPNLVIVYGDTNSTLAGALACAKLHIPVAHVEAGLRSFNKKMPEEINRIVADHTADLLFCPTQTAINNLKQENITNNLFHVGDLMYDACIFAKSKFKDYDFLLQEHDVTKDNFILATVHRAENTKNLATFTSIIDYIDSFAHNENKIVLLPSHPRTEKLRLANKIQTKNIKFIPPVGYFAMQFLINNSAYVLTDSGGVQKEAYFHNTPCVTLRSETEWLETINFGHNRLMSVPTFKTKKPITDYGSGDSAKLIIEKIINFLE